MKVVRCENGHFFDGEKYKSCPHCSKNTCDNDNRKLKENPERQDIVMGLMISPRDEFISEDPIGTLVDICAKDAHEFENIERSTGGTKYRCKKCGLDAVSYYPEELNIGYYGSIVDSQTFMWHSDYMKLSDIVQIEVSYGDCPIHIVAISNDTLTYKNTINGSRDGWMQFSEGYFDPHTLTLSLEQKNELFDLLYQLNLPSWETDSHIFNILNAPGFCLHDTFTCEFSNGYSFICYSAGKYKDFHRLTALLDKLTGLQRQPQTIPNRMISGIKTSCCEIMIPERFWFCPKCGMRLEDKESLLHTEISYDFDQTCWLCDCLESNAFNHQFCGNCGKKRPW